MDLKTNFIREQSDLNAAVLESIDVLRYGSFSQRNPGLGRMKMCPICKHRTRELATIPCCTGGHSKTKRAWSEGKGFYQAECEPRVNSEKAGMHNLIKRFQHKRHSNKLRKKIHDMVIALQTEEFRNTTQFLLEGLPGFWEPQKGLNIQHIPQFAERVVKNIRLNAANKKRKQQRKSRLANRRTE